MINWIKARKMNMQNGVTGFSNDVRSKDAKSVYYLITILSDFATSTMSATYVLFLLSQHLDLLQVNLVNLAFMTGNFIFEIPTGAYADFFGRKKSVMLSSFFIFIALGVYFISSSLPMFILAETIAALAFTFESGALDAWIVDSLEQKSYVGKVDYIFSHASIFGQVASLLGGLVGAYIGSTNLRYPMGLGAIMSLIALMVAFLFMHEQRATKHGLSFGKGFIQLGQIAKESVSYGVRHKVVFWLLISSVLAMFAFQPLNMYWSPRLNTLAGNQIWLMGWVWAGICLFMIFGNLLAKKLLQQNKACLWILKATALFLSVPILFASMSNIFYVVLTGFLTYEVGRGLLKPIQKSYLNQHIPSDKRATVLSFESMVGKLGAAGGLVVLGWVGKNYSIQDAWLVAGILLLFLIPIYLKVTHNENHLIQM